MKWSKFVKQIQALGYHCEADALDNDLVTRVEVYTLAGKFVASIDDMTAYNYMINGYQPDNDKAFGSESQHRLVVLLIQQMANTKIENRGIVPIEVKRNSYEERHAVEV